LGIISKNILLNYNFRFYLLNFFVIQMLVF